MYLLSLECAVRRILVKLLYNIKTSLKTILFKTIYILFNNARTIVKKKYVLSMFSFEDQYEPYNTLIHSWFFCIFFCIFYRFGYNQTWAFESTVLCLRYLLNVIYFPLNIILSASIIRDFSCLILSIKWEIKILLKILVNVCCKRSIIYLLNWLIISMTT